MSEYLYINYKGQPVTVHSYSSGAKFDNCPQDYYLEKVAGWRRKERKASLKFGICFEEGLMFYHNSGLAPGSGIDEFKRRWLAFKDDASMQFTDKEGSWSDLYRIGADLLRLYEIMLPSLPISQPAFQLNYRREVFPNTEFAGIEHTAFIDMVSKAPWVHPLLPRTTIPAGAAHRPVLIDIKTAGASLGDALEMLELDPQLREYAWTASIPDIAFLTAVKARPDVYDRGTAFTVLEATDRFQPGDQVVTLGRAEATDTDAAGAKPAAALCMTASAYEEFCQASKGVKGKKLDQLKADWITERGEEIATHRITRARIEFSATRISPEDMIEAGQNVGRQIVEIINARRTGRWPKRPGVRFPNNKCTMCDKRGICLNKPALRDAMLVQITPSEKEDDWIDELSAV